MKKKKVRLKSQSIVKIKKSSARSVFKKQLERLQTLYQWQHELGMATDFEKYLEQKIQDMEDLFRLYSKVLAEMGGDDHDLESKRYIWSRITSRRGRRY